MRLSILVANASNSRIAIPRIKTAISSAGAGIMAAATSWCHSERSEESLEISEPFTTEMNRDVSLRST
jgi:hypothetical protein